MLRPLDDGGAADGTAPGAVVCDHVDDAVLERVRALSHSGQRRVVAIATTAPLVRGPVVWRLLRSGVADVVAWDGRPDVVLARIERWRQVEEIARSPLVADHLVGSSAAWRSAMREVVEIARFSDLDVLITGPSGTGKELTARLIHTLDSRREKGALVVVDCTTIVPTLSGSEFFGHERGAFTGADAARDGAFARADGGTLFLDEVGELPPALQTELLRVVQEGTYKRVGSNRWQTSRFRLVCATNRDLARARAAGEFRSDLFFRLAAATVDLPPLDERPQDVLELARHFLTSGPDDAPAMTDAVRELLQGRRYPGNVRDLKQLIARIRLRHVGPGPVTVGDLPLIERPDDATPDGWREDLHTALGRAIECGIPLREIVDASRDAAIALAMTAANGSLHHAARRLGVTDRTLQLHRARRRGAAPA